MSLDALAYTSIKNNATENSDHTWLETKLTLTGGFKGKTKSIKNAYLDNILDKTTIKRACCTANKSDLDTVPVAVRIPIPNSVRATLNRSDDDPLGFSPNDKHQYKTFKYYDKTVHIPKSVCSQMVPGYNAGTNQCDDFYEVYCYNSKKFFKDKVGYENYDHNKFVSYKPECACYGDTTGFSTFDFPRKCVFKGCKEKSAYTDYSSRSGTCSLTLCQNIINAANADVGGN